VGLKRTQLEERYELRRILGEGGMGVVYAAFDCLMQREVALKTILDFDAETMAMFENEWNLLANMVHPNVISIYDIGEFENEGMKKPFFVMPLLPGVTLDRLIRDGSPRRSVAGALGIIEQACRGLHAAHQQGLVHRDVKPSNIFVMEDNSVKVIDFGLALGASTKDTNTMRGTYPYMAPEQFGRKPPTPLSDLFSLGVVTYHALTRKRPFQGNEDQTIEAIQRFNPPPVSSLNREVNYSISMVIAKAMAKQPRHRFGNMLEFAEALQKAARNEPLEWFDPAKVKARLERATRAFEQGDYGFACEVLGELEGEGHLDEEIALLRSQVDGAVRQARIRQLLESARRFYEATEYPLALLKIQEALEIDPSDADAMLLQSQVEKKRRENKISEWIDLARLHLENLAFRQAREALDNVLQARPNDTAALALLSEVGRQEQELSRIREDKSRVYDSARQSWEKGEVTSALSRLEILIGLDREHPDSDPSRSAIYQNFFNLVSTEHNAQKNAYEEARCALAADDSAKALSIARQYLAKYPNHALFQALLFDVENHQRQRVSAAIAETDRRVQAEPDLDRRMGILLEALRLFPNEPHFEGALRSVRDKRGLLNSIVEKARFFEERGQINEALEQWQILKSIHSEHPELSFEIPRLMKLRDRQVRESSRNRLVEQISKYLEDGDYERARLMSQDASAEFPEDPRFAELLALADQNQRRAHRALEFLEAAQEIGEAGSFENGIGLLRQANQLDPRNIVIRTVLVNWLLDRGRRVVDTDCNAAADLLREALQLEPGCPAAEGLASRIAERCLDAEHLDAPPPAAPIVTETRIQCMPSAPKSAAPPPPPPPAPPPIPPVSPELPPVEAAEPVKVEAVEPAAPVPLAAKPRAGIPIPDVSTATIRKSVYGLLGVAAILIVLTVVSLVTRNRRPKLGAPVQYRVSLLSRLGAQIKVNGKPCGVSQCDLSLEPGTYQAEALMAGFLPASATFTVSPEKGAPGAIDLPMSPAAPLVNLSSDLPSGSVMVDGTPAGTIQDGVAKVQSLIQGTHELSIQSGELQASVILDVAEGASPKVTAPIQAKGLRVFVVVVSGNAAEWYASDANLKIALDGKAQEAKQGMEIKDLIPGAHELTVTGAKGEERVTFEAKSATAVYVRITRVR